MYEKKSFETHLLVESVFHTLTVVSEEPEIVFEPSLLIRTAFTEAVWLVIV